MTNPKRMNPCQSGRVLCTALAMWLCIVGHTAVARLPGLAELPREPQRADTAKGDWLVVAETAHHASVYRTENDREIVMSNGLIRRAWRFEPNGACVAFDNLMTGKSMLRSVRPEARVTINGSAYDVGGLVGQPNHAYLSPQWLNAMTADARALRLVGYQVDKSQARFGWKRRRHAAPDAAWPPRGAYLRMDYQLPPTDVSTGAGDIKAALRISVHYEMYDGVPVMSKWITVHNDSDKAITVDRFTSEELAVVEQTNWVEARKAVAVPRPEYIHVETDFAFSGFNSPNANHHVVHWRADPLYSTQVNYLRQTPCLLVVEPTYGPAQSVAPGGQFESHRTFEMVYDSSDRDRRGLALKRMYRTVAPWVTENPITHHLLSNDPNRVRDAIDQAAAVGFEAIIMSFGSGFNMENRDPDFIAKWKAIADYAEEKGIELGSYSLFSSRGVGGDHMIVSPQGQRPTHGQCPAVTSQWGLQWLKTIRAFYHETGFDQFENDGPYLGDVDTTARPPLQRGADDSRWVQWRLTASLYHDLRGRGVYINAPDFYYLSGSNKCGMGYREVNWSLPRAQQVIHTRQNIYDGTWEKTPSMGWMFVPLAQYHGGGAAATIEPLDQHRDHYQRMLMSNLGMGVQAHYRGPRLFDTDATKDMVMQAVKWFREYRDILESDMVHGRRADGHDLDWMLHVNPRLKHKGMLVVYNPLEVDVTRTIDLNLYYTGLTEQARIRTATGEAKEVTLSRDYKVQLEVTVPAGGMTWYVIE